MGGQAQDGEEPIEASASIALGLVPEEPASTDRGPTPDAQAEAARPLRVLWDHGNFASLQDSWRKRERSGNNGSRGAAAMARSPGQTSSVWNGVTAYQAASGPQSAGQRSEVMR